MKEYKQYSDLQLTKLLRKGHPICDAAFRELYDRLSDKLHAYCLFKTDRFEDAEEIFRDAWLKFHKAAVDGKDIDKPQALLYRIARNLSIDMYRSNKSRMIQNINDLDYQSIADPLNLQLDIEKEELLSIISAAVNNLGDKYKETFVLLWFSGFSYSEIADITGETSGNIRKISYRAMEQLIKMLDPVIKELS